jgi:hypothetical protein
MQSSFTIGLIAGAISGAVCGGLTVFLLDSGDVTENEASGAEAGLRLQLSEMRESQAARRSRLDKLETRPLLTASERETAPVARDLVEEQFEERVRSVLAKVQSDKPARPVLLPEVEQAMRMIEQEKEQELQVAREQAMAERIEDRLARASELLTLAPDQVNSLRTTLTQYGTETTDLFTSARDTGDFGSVRDQIRTLRDTAQTSLTLILTATQLEQYENSDLNLLGFGGDSRRGGFGGGGDFGRGGEDRGRGGRERGQ